MEKELRRLSAQLQDSGKAVREGGMDRNRAKDIVVSGDQTEGSEAGQLDGPVPRGGTTRGPVRQIVEALGVDPLPRLWW